MTSPGDRRRELVRVLANGIERALVDASTTDTKSPGRCPSAGHPEFRVVGQRVVSERPLVIEGKIDPAWVEARRRRQERARGRGEPKLPGARTAPLVSRMLAKAHRFERQLRRGRYASFSEIAAAEHVTKARVTQIMNLLLLAPDIQEEILCLPRPSPQSEQPSERDLRRVCRTAIWSEQRRLWMELKGRQRVRLFIAASPSLREQARSWGTDHHVRRTKTGVVVSMRVCPSPEFVAWVLSHGDKVEVLEPRSLRERVAGALRRAAQRYRPPPDA